MKKPYLFKKPLLFIFLFAVIAVVFIVNSCKKEAHSSKADTKSLIADTSLINQAKVWYQNVYPQTGSTKKVQDAGASQQDWSQTFIPVWANGQTYVKDSLTIIELPVLKKGNMAFSTSQTNADNFDFTKSTSITTLLIVIDKGTIGAYAMTIMADSSYTRGDYTKLKNNTYRKKDKDFTGYVFYNELNGTFVNGWRYVNGSVINAITQQAATTTSPGNQSVKLKIDVADPNGCTQIVTEFWEECSYYDNDVNYENPFNCFDYTVTNSYSVPCSSSNGNGGSGDVTPPPVPPCIVPPTTVENINGHLRIFTASPPPPGGGGTGTTTDSTAITNPCTPDIKVDSLYKKFPCVVKDILNQLLSFTDYQNLTIPFQNCPKPDLVWNATTALPWNTPVPNQPGQFTYQTGNTATDPQSSTGASSDIDLSSQMIQNSSALMVAATAIHETLHAYLNYYLAYQHSGSDPTTSWVGAAYDYSALNYQQDMSNSDFVQHTSMMIKSNFDSMVNILAEFDNNQNSMTTYREIMLYGLNNPGNVSATSPEGQAVAAAFTQLAAYYGIDTTKLSTFMAGQLNAASNLRVPTNCP